MKEECTDAEEMIFSDPGENAIEFPDMLSTKLDRLF